MGKYVRNISKSYLQRGGILIFVILGSQKFQFNRLLKYIDELIEDGTIVENVFAQIGHSDYIPQNYGYKNFLNQDEFKGYMKSCSLVITHGGSGAIIMAVKSGKKVIAVSRKAEYKEHVDDHQDQIIKEFQKLNFILAVQSKEELAIALKNIEKMKLKEYISNTRVIVESISEYIDNIKETNK